MNEFVWRWENIRELNEQLVVIVNSDPSVHTIQRIQDITQQILNETHALKMSINHPHQTNHSYQNVGGLYFQPHYDRQGTSFNSTIPPSNSHIHHNQAPRGHYSPPSMPHSSHMSQQSPKNSPFASTEIYSFPDNPNPIQYSSPVSPIQEEFTNPLLMVSDAPKLKMPHRLQCDICKMTDSPEWRKGPNGRKTLCNACGIHFAKKEKQEKVILKQQGYEGDTLERMVVKLHPQLAQQVYDLRVKKKRSKVK